MSGSVWSGALCHGRHACGIVASGSERLRMVSDFVRSGLVAGDRVWCFPNGRRADVLRRLREDGVADDEVLASGQLTVLPAHESALAAVASDPDAVLDGLRHAVDDALADGWNGFRIVGDPGWAMPEVSCPQRLIDFEERVNDVFADSPATALCQYDRFRFDTATMSALVRAHAEVLCPEAAPGCARLTVAPLLTAPGLQFSGSVDLGNRTALREALEQVLAGSGDVHLELSDLAFIDIGGARVILQCAERLGPGRRLVLHHPPRSLRLALGLLWYSPNLMEAGPT